VRSLGPAHPGQRVGDGDQPAGNPAIRLQPYRAAQHFCWDVLTPDHRAAIRGGTDGEHLLHLILSSLAQMGGSLFASLEAALRHVIMLCREIGQEPHLGVNVLRTEGVRMVGSRWRRTLHFLEKAGAAACPGERPGRAVDHDSDHRVGADRRHRLARDPGARSAFEVTPDLRLRIEPLDES
jgi:hypothetical protein